MDLESIRSVAAGSSTSMSIASYIMGMTHRMEGEGFEDFGEADFVQLMEDKELDENHLDDMVNETNYHDKDPDEEESQPIVFI
ncbi:hypothetical protein CDAR_127201 [Caerostris darwini]|uniref:Uncharacterized protein n=1 Tax=Caerostris darwini TaxID=1538125 RepID=A0AAV4X7X0_9ARAC|nr:hypothetical protein CDAR_127201 [Caerostris darwini]